MKFLAFFFFLVLICCSNAYCLDKNNSGDTDFESSRRQILPVDPEQIFELRKGFEKAEKAKIEGVQPKVFSGTRNISIRPGGQQPKITLTKGYVSSIIFQDATGAPWPIDSARVGDDSLYSVPFENKSEPDGGVNGPRNLLTIVPLLASGSSNLVVILEGQDVPIILLLQSTLPTSKQRKTDTLVAFRVDERGPNAEAPVVGGAVDPVVNSDLLRFLDGTPPNGAKMLETIPELPDFNLWSYSGKNYVVTRNTLLWPAWTSSARSNKLYVYEVQPVHSLLVLANGQRKTLNVKAPE